MLGQFWIILSLNTLWYQICFFSCSRHCDCGLIFVIVYYSQILNKKRTQHYQLFAVTWVLCVLRNPVYYLFNRNNYNFSILMSRVFANGQGERGSITGWVIPKTQKWYLMPPRLTPSNISLGSKVKWGNPGNGVGPSSKPRWSSYWKGGFWVTLDKGR